MIKEEFRKIEESLSIAKTKKALKVILKQSHSKLKSILKDNRLSKEVKKEAMFFYKGLKQKINLIAKGIK